MKSLMQKIIIAIAEVAAIMTCGCGLPLQPMPSPQPQPTPIVTPPANTTHTIKLEIGGDGKIQVVGGADIKLTQPAGGGSTPSGSACDCGCGHSSLSDCEPGCPRRAILRTSSPSNSAGQGCPPQFVKTRKVYQCRNGVCGWYDVPVSQPKQTQRTSGSGAIKVYLQPKYLESHNASLSMRKAVGESAGIEWLYGQPPAIEGRYWWPTAVKPDGTTFTPGEAGWSADSLGQFRAWAK